MHDFWWQAAWGDWEGPEVLFDPPEKAAMPHPEYVGSWHPVGSVGSKDGPLVLWRRCLQVFDQALLDSEIQAFQASLDEESS